MTDVVDLESIRDCLRAGLPAPMATCSPDGTPHISNISQVEYLDRERVATSRQPFNRTLEHLQSSPFSQAMVVRPTTGEQFRLDLRYLHTATEGEEFEAMRATFERSRRRRIRLGAPAARLDAIACCAARASSAAEQAVAPAAPDPSCCWSSSLVASSGRRPTRRRRVRYRRARGPVRLPVLALIAPGHIGPAAG